jgi:hypothetical protein
MNIEIATMKLAIRISDAAEFDREFYKILGKKNCTHTQAYEELEQVYVQVYGRRRYANVESYRIARRRRIKR